jgi:methyl-accepting chemotaxis protein
MSSCEIRTRRRDRRNRVVGSTELEASAGTLTATAERAQEAHDDGRGGSEEASTNVQSVALATEEMSSSVNEISRQVQESARMASEAVDQARNQRSRQRIVEGRSRIGDVVELINTIAGRPICWRSTPPSRRRAPARPAAALPSWPRK